MSAKMLNRVLPLPGSGSSVASIHAKSLNLTWISSRPRSSFIAFSPKTSSQSLAHLISYRGYDSFKARVVSIPETAGDRQSAADAIHTIRLSVLFGIWYSLNIYFNIFNKQVLKVFPYPASLTAFQLGCGTVMVLTMWALKLHPRPKLTRSRILAFMPLVIAHTAGNLLTNVSLGKVAVSFTHTIKAMEPFFTVLFSSLFLFEKPSIWVISSLLPIVGGVALASFTESSFNWIGFSAAMASNVTNQSRNVLSKRLMNLKEEALDNINMFSIITIFSFLLLLPSALLLEGVKLSPSHLNSLAANGVNVRELIIRCFLSGFCFHSYQQVSYMILQMVNAVTHAVGNSVKRVVVIVSSVLFFQTPVSPVNSIGTAMALAGVFLYSKAKRMNLKLKTV